MPVSANVADGRAIDVLDGALPMVLRVLFAQYFASIESSANLVPMLRLIIYCVCVCVRVFGICVWFL